MPNRRFESDGDPSTMKNPTPTLTTVTAIALLIAAAVAPAAAAPTDDFADDVEDDRTILSAASAVVDGIVTRALYTIDTRASEAIGVLGDSDTGPNAAAEAREFKDYVNPRMTDFQDYVNSRVTASTELDVLALEFQNNTASETVYVVAEVDNGSYTNSTVTSSTNRSIDETITVKDMALTNVNTEVETLYTEYVEPNRDLRQSYIDSKVALYWNHLETSFTDGVFDHVPGVT